MTLALALARKYWSRARVITWALIVISIALNVLHYTTAAWITLAAATIGLQRATYWRGWIDGQKSAQPKVENV